MGVVSSKDIQQADILRLEAEMNNLWGELNTATISHSARSEMEGRLAGCEEQFKAVLGGQASFKELETSLKQIELLLTMAVIFQAQNEIPKAEHHGSAYQALENICRNVKEGTVSPVRARHEVKDIMRHHPV